MKNDLARKLALPSSHLLNYVSDPQDWTFKRPYKQTLQVQNKSIISHPWGKHHWRRSQLIGQKPGAYNTNFYQPANLSKVPGQKNKPVNFKYSHNANSTYCIPVFRPRVRGLDREHLQKLLLHNRKVFS